MRRSRTWRKPRKPCTSRPTICGWPTTRPKTWRSRSWPAATRRWRRSLPSCRESSPRLRQG